MEAGVDVEVKQVEAEAEKKLKKTEAVAWENPLIPNARMRQIYLAMVRARALARVLPPAKRSQTLGLEAALVSAAIDLGPSDLVSDAVAGGVVDFLRGATVASVLKARKASKRGVGVRGEANCGTAALLPGTPEATERVWVALGAAAALKAARAQAKVVASTAAKVEDEAGDDEQTARQSDVVVFYALPGELTTALWKKALTFAMGQELPIIFVALPEARVRGDSARKAKVGGVNALAMGCGVPGIAVDADDAVAIYRVAQESIGRARIGGGTVLMECVPFVLEVPSAKGTPPADAIATMEHNLLGRGIITKVWIEREAKSFAKRLAR